MRSQRIKFACVVLATCLACGKYVYVPPSTFIYDGPVSDGVSYRQLTRDDFQATKPVAPPERGTIIAQTAVACITDTFSILPVSAGAESWVTSLDHVHVRAIMYPKASWWDPGRKSVKDVQRMLEHEQGHFDIAELVARQYNARLQAIRVEAPSPSRSLEAAKERLRREAAGIEQLLTDWNAQYDLETKNGTHRREQMRWGEEISRQLAETSPLARDHHFSRNRFLRRADATNVNAARQ